MFLLLAVEEGSSLVHCDWSIRLLVLEVDDALHAWTKNLCLGWLSALVETGQLDRGFASFDTPGRRRRQ